MTGGASARARALGPVALLAAVACVPFHRVILHGEAVFQRDVQLMWFTHVQWLARAVSAGSAPFWDPYVGFGQPLLADANNQVLYPPTWLNLVLQPWTAYAAIAIAHLTIAGLGLYRLARRLGVPRGSALLGGGVLCACGPLVSLVSVWNQLAGAAWLPWALVACDEAVRRPRPRAVIAWAVPVALQVLAGAPEMALASALGSAAWTAAVLWGERRSLPAYRALAAAAVAASLAALLSAAQWMPSLAAARDAGRAALPVEERTYLSVHPAALVELLLPATLADLPLTPAARATLFDSWDPFLHSLHLGLATLPFVAAALAGRRRSALTLAGFFAACVGLALGRHAPVHALAETALPLLRLLRYPAKALVPAAFAWALLAALGHAALARGDTAARRAALVAASVGAAAALGLAALAALLAWPAWFQDGSAGAAAARPALVLGGAACAAVLVALAAGARWSLPVAAVAAVGQLVLLHGNAEPTSPRALYAYRPPALDRVVGPEPRLYAYDYFVAGASARHLGRATPFVLARVPDGWSLPAAQALGLRMYLFPPVAGALGVAGSFDLDVPRVAPEALDRLRRALLSAEGTDAHLRLLQLGSVTNVTSLHEQGLEALAPLATLPGLFREPVRVFAVPAPLPRAYVVDGVRTARGEEALSLLEGGALDARREVVLEAGAARSPTAGFVGAASVASRDGAHVALESESSGAGYLVLTEAWAPGWTARVDGEDAALLRANTAFRAVAVPAGRHRVVMAYAPPGLAEGAATTSATLAMLALAGVVASARARRAARA